MRLFLLLFMLSCLKADAYQERMNPQAALQRLMQGNERYMKDELQHPDRTAFRRESIAQKQMPFAVILGCSDSRVSPEIIFDQGLGDLFVVRVAGNVLGPIEQDSIEFAVKYLHSCLIFVMGHEGCGAVSAVLEHNTADIEEVASLIEPSLALVRKEGGKNLLPEAVKANVKAMMTKLNAFPVIEQLVHAGKLAVKGGYYELQSGRVELLAD